MRTPCRSEGAARPTYAPAFAGPCLRACLSEYARSQAGTHRQATAGKSYGRA